ncbi:hypothetical protein CNMCM8980_005733 [Aspergillus fumigatiaffinis]|uniref:Uncharacterized protein n=1 Tax=Aspergillus fumigatiaffinis TaxID=340414 RepID=A0A8H4H1X1_9EURO|nr:hypothetical protein CNMCM5878_005916 [Aspergillus fumigatiaffinis]KAF4234046.1 hypothetical protein CNMCM6457_004195 [Aspergillus fumigatiaffinis]KAF4243839.1 hypothetical protein CNMCM6805_010350 [Aspergillus fumigatiaffinis]KAF4248575.1 hypothetical protein CNMCM8980_005733 [Aspergillus fumigatiaffinis]
MRATQLALLALAASAKLATSFKIPEGMMDGFTRNHGDCDRAVQNLKNQFGGGTVRIGPNLAWYSISGSVVAFACNKVAAQAEASADRLTRALQGITERCGCFVVCRHLPHRDLVDPPHPQEAPRREAQSTTYTRLSFHRWSAAAAELTACTAALA